VTVVDVELETVAVSDVLALDEPVVEVVVVDIPCVIVDVQDVELDTVAVVVVLVLEVPVVEVVVVGVPCVTVGDVDVIAFRAIDCTRSNMVSNEFGRRCRHAANRFGNIQKRNEYKTKKGGMHPRTEAKMATEP